MNIRHTRTHGSNFHVNRTGSSAQRNTSSIDYTTIHIPNLGLDLSGLYLCCNTVHLALFFFKFFFSFSFHQYPGTIIRRDT